MEIDDVLQDSIERQLRSPAEQLADLGHARDATVHVLEADLVRLLVGDVHDVRLPSGERGNLSRKVEDRDLAVVAEVVDLPVRRLFGHQVREGADDVEDVGETAALGAVAVDGERLAREPLADERGDDHAVLAGLAGTDGVEEAHDHGRQLALAPVCDCEKLVDRLRARVRPAALVGGSHHEIALFAEGEIGALAVHFARRGDEHGLLLLVREVEDNLGAADVGLDRAHGALDDELDPDCSGEVIDDVHRVHELGGHTHVVDRVDHVVEARVLLQMGDVVDRPG